MSKERPLILIVDDEGKVTKAFKEDHGNDYRIESINKIDIGFISDKLKTTYSGEAKPDLILTDLKHEVIDPALDGLKKEIWDKMALLKESISQYNTITRPVILKHGINVLKTARKVYGNNIPVAIYTGTSFIAEYMNSTLLEEHLELNGEWIQMRLGKTYESVKIERLLDGKKEENKKPFILIIDGKGKPIKGRKSQPEEFIENHNGEYRIVSINTKDVAFIEEVFKNEYSGDNRPDLILTDFMAFKNDEEPLKQKIFSEADRFKVLIDELNEMSQSAYKSHGFQLLEIVREVYQDDTPVAIYTGFGIITEYNNIKDHTKVVKLNGEWFQKKLGKNFESKKIKQLLNKKKEQNK